MLNGVRLICIFLYIFPCFLSSWGFYLFLLILYFSAHYVILNLCIFCINHSNRIYLCMYMQLQRVSYIIFKGKQKTYEILIEQLTNETAEYYEQLNIIVMSITYKNYALHNSHIVSSTKILFTVQQPSLLLYKISIIKYPTQQEISSFIQK